MKKIVFLLVIALCLFTKNFLQDQKPDPDYLPVKSSSLLQDKNFYLLTLFEKIKGVATILQSDKTLNSIAKEHIASLNNIPFECKDSLKCYACLLYTSDAAD